MNRSQLRDSDGFQVVKSRNTKKPNKPVRYGNQKNYSKQKPSVPKQQNQSPVEGQTQVNKTNSNQNESRPINPNSFKKNTQNSLRVTKLKTFITEDQLRNHFEQVSPVDTVKIPKNKAGNTMGYAFINFSSHDKGIY